MRLVVQIAAGIVLALAVVSGGCVGCLGVGNVLHETLPPVKP